MRIVMVDILQQLKENIAFIQTEAERRRREAGVKQIDGTPS